MNSKWRTVLANCYKLLHVKTFLTDLEMLPFVLKWPRAENKEKNFLLLWRDDQRAEMEWLVLVSSLKQIGNSEMAGQSEANERNKPHLKKLPLLFFLRLLSRNSQNFLGKFKGFFVTLRCFLWSSYLNDFMIYQH